MSIKQKNINAIFIAQSSFNISMINPSIEAKDAKKANLPENILLKDVIKFLFFIENIFLQS